MRDKVVDELLTELHQLRDEELALLKGLTQFPSFEKLIVQLHDRREIIQGRIERLLIGDER